MKIGFSQPDGHKAKVQKRLILSLYILFLNLYHKLALSLNLDVTELSIFTMLRLFWYPGCIPKRLPIS